MTSPRRPRPMAAELAAAKLEARASFLAERIALRIYEAGQSEEEAKRGALEDWERYIAPPGWRQMKMMGEE